MDVRRVLRAAFEGGGAILMFWMMSVANVEAAVVTRVRAASTPTMTRIVVDLDGEFRHTTRVAADGKSIVVEIAGSRLAERTSRVVPIADARVDGVLVSFDDAARTVRLSIDLAGRVAPELRSEAEDKRLVISLARAGQLPAVAAAAPSSRANAGPPDPAAHHRVAARGAAPPPTAASRAAPSPSPPFAAAARLPAPPPAATKAAVTRRSIVEKVVVVLDPGHGGKDPGAKAWTGEFEKDIVLDLTERVARRLREGGGVEVVMTRSGDEYVSLSDRRDVSGRWGAAAFVSIHANASPSAAARGIETYYHSASADPAVRRLARAENGGKAARSGARLASTATALARQAESVRLAESVQGQLVRQLGMRYEAVRDLGAKEGPFFVIGENAAPSVLVEAAFLTHREEGLRMRSEVYRERIAAGVARGILDFLDEQRRAGAL